MRIKLKVYIRKHEAIIITVIVLLGILYNSELNLDSSLCSVKNPDIDCTQRGIIPLATIQQQQMLFQSGQNSTGGAVNWAKTTGFGTHYINGVAVPEYRNGYQHAVCDLNATMTCEYHFDTYNALDFPFGTVLHLADWLTITVGFLDENLWQGTIWVVVMLLLYIGLKRLDKVWKKHIRF